MTTTISSYEAKTKLPALLRRAEKGETIIITRRGVEVAQITPSPTASLKRRQQAFKDLLELRKKLKPSMSSEEVKSMIHEGHKW